MKNSCVSGYAECGSNRCCFCGAPGESDCSNGVDDDGDGKVDCKDPDCAGMVGFGPGGATCCQSDDDCTYVDCGNYVVYCDYTTNICKCYTSCTDMSQCADGACCTDDPTGPRDGTYKCVGKGVYSSKYLCDPPKWGISKSLEETEKASTIFDFIFGLFKNVFD